MRAHYRKVTFSLVILLTLSVLTGCLGRSITQPQAPQYGTIRGQVVSGGTQEGLAGVYVYIEGTTLGTFTDDNGLYTLTRVPVGVQTVVVEYDAPSFQPLSASTFMLTLDADDTPALLQDGQPVALADALATFDSSSTQRISVEVAVLSNEVTLVSTVTIPVFGAVDNIFLYHADPLPGGNIPAERNSTLYYDVHYALNTADRGHVFVLLTGVDPLGAEKTEYQRSLAVPRGSGSAVLEIPISSIQRPYLDLYIALTDAEGTVLALKSLGSYTVSGGSIPLAPALEVLGLVDGDLHLGLYGGNPVGFQRYEFSAGIDPRCGSGSYRFTSTDPDLSLIVVEDVPEGMEQKYVLCMVTEDGSTISSGRLSHTAPLVGVTDISLGRGVVNYRLADPWRDVLYLSVPARNEVLVLSTVTDRIEAAIPVGPGPSQLAISPEGAYLYVGHAQGSGVGIVNLTTRTMERWIPTDREPSAVAVHPITGYLYVIHGIHRLSEIDPETGTTLREHALDDPYRSDIRLYFSDDGDLLFRYRNGRYDVLRTVDLTESASLVPLEAGYLPFVIDGRLHFAQRVYDSLTLGLIDDHPYHIIAYNRDEGRIYALVRPWPDSRSDPGFRHLLELTYHAGTGAWVPTLRIAIPASTTWADTAELSADGQYLYLRSWSYATGVDFRKIDLWYRRSIHS